MDYKNMNMLKQETLEEVDENKKNLYYYKQIMNPYPVEEYSHTVYEKGFVDGYEKASKWQQEQMYSEEEVKRFAFDFYYDMSRKMKVPENLVSENETNVDVWFKQYKKK